MQLFRRSPASGLFHDFILSQKIQALNFQICVERCLKRNEGRSDDNEESLRKRIKTYHTQTIPIIEYYKAKNLVRQVSATAPPEEVFYFSKLRQ